MTVVLFSFLNLCNVTPSSQTIRSLQFALHFDDVFFICQLFKTWDLSGGWWGWLKSVTWNHVDAWLQLCATEGDIQLLNQCIFSTSKFTSNIVKKADKKRLFDLPWYMSAPYRTVSITIKFNSAISNFQKPNTFEWKTVNRFLFFLTHPLFKTAW